jgi:hypothetical protein
MIIVPETPITEASFQKWKCHRVDFIDDELGDSFYCYAIPLIDVTEDEMDSMKESVPALWSSESTEFTDENGEIIYTMRLFDEDLPELTTEEEVEILYKLLTKREIYS